MADANVEMREFWNGEDAREWVVSADRFDGMLEPFATLLLERAALAPTDRVLDIGCGNGITTIEAARRVPQGAATGIDISAPMLEVATGRAVEQGVDNVTFTLGDAQTDTISGVFDVAVSRFGIMFFDDPVAAFTNIRSTLAPGGRVVFACWRTLPENEWVLVPSTAILEHVPLPEPPPADAPGPFRFGEAGSLDAVLSDAGFIGVESEAVDQPVLLGGRGSVEDAFAFSSHSTMSRRFLGDAEGETRDRALAGMRSALEPFATDEGVRMGSAIWLVRARVP